MMAGKIENQEIISLTKQDNSSAYKLQFWVHFVVSFACGYVKSSCVTWTRTHNDK